MNKYIKKGVLVFSVLMLMLFGAVFEGQAQNVMTGDEDFLDDIIAIESDLKSQTVDVLRDDQIILDAYLEAKQTKVPKNIKRKENPLYLKAVPTDLEVIKSLLSEDLNAKLIDLDFDEVKLTDIFMTVGKAGNINVMLDPDYKGYLLDLHLKNVSIPEAFLLIGNAYNLGFKKVRGSLYVTAKDKIREENEISRVIKLVNIRAEDAKTMVADLIGTVNYSEEINSLIVVGQPDEVVKVQDIVKMIDLPQPQVVLEAKIIEINKDALKEVGVDWSDSINLDYQEILREPGFDDVSTYTGGGLYEFFPIQRSAMQFTTIIKMLENQNKAKVLSNPRITTLNDKEAEIFVGDRIPYTITTVTGGVVTTEVKFEEPGIRLTITPSIIEDDFVVIKVQPEVSYIFSWRGADDQYPWVKKRSATAYVRVKDRKTFILGGLLNQEDKKNLYKVPMLADVPLLGNLFTYQKDTILDTELIISITPTIVSSY